mgnify:CR=1 FL=1
MTDLDLMLKINGDDVETKREMRLLSMMVAVVVEELELKLEEMMMNSNMLVTGHSDREILVVVV